MDNYRIIGNIHNGFSRRSVLRPLPNIGFHRRSAELALTFMRNSRMAAQIVSFHRLQALISLAFQSLSI